MRWGGHSCPPATQGRTGMSAPPSQQVTASKAASGRVPDHSGSGTWPCYPVARRGGSPAPRPSDQERLTIVKKTLEQREKELRPLLTTLAGKKELQELAARYS